jgi:hypothetical protein
MKSIVEYIGESVFDKDLVQKDVPKVKLEDVDNRDSALAYIEQNYKTAPEKSWEKKGKAIRIVYNSRLSMRIDFINKYEFLYTIYGPNDEELFDCNSTREAYSVNWGEFLDIRKYAANLKAKRASFGKNKSGVDRMHKLADKIYELI